jgi:hypothetical protein
LIFENKIIEIYESDNRESIFNIIKDYRRIEADLDE